MVDVQGGPLHVHGGALRGEGVSYLFAGKQDLDLALLLEILNRELGIKRLLLEGGGRANGSFLRAGLVDRRIDPWTAAEQVLALDA